MPRNMSFSMTTEAVRRREKTVTRRLGWWNLKPGDILCAVEKGMGLKKGEKVKRLGLIRVVSVTHEPLNAIRFYDPEECAREGFPHYSRTDFMAMLMQHYRVGPEEPVNRIEFEYLEEAPHA